MYLIAHNGSSILGGGELAVAWILHGLQMRGHRVMLLCRDESMREQLSQFEIPLQVLRIGGTAMLPDAAKFALALRRHRPDAVLLTTFKKVLIAGLGARLAGVPLVIQRVGLSTDRPRSVLYRFAFRHLVDVVALNAEQMRQGFVAGDQRMDSTKVVTVLDGVRTPSISRGRTTVRADFGIPVDAPVFGAVARLAPQKRFDRLVRTLAHLPEDAHCLIAGEGEQRESLERLARELGVRDRLHLPGFRWDIGDILAALDVFVVSSDREGMANAMLEAMAAGVPVVSTPVSGAREALGPFPDGAAPGVVVDDAVLAETIADLLRDRDLRGGMGEAGRRRVGERYSFEHLMDRWEALLTNPGAFISAAARSPVWPGATSGLQP